MRLPLIALLLAGCAEGRLWYTVYDLEAGCETPHQGHPPGMADGTCDPEAEGRSVFWDDEGRCWVGARCVAPGDQEGYAYASEGDDCFDLFLDPPRWPRC